MSYHRNKHTKHTKHTKKRCPHGKIKHPKSGKCVSIKALKSRPNPRQKSRHNARSKQAFKKSPRSKASKIKSLLHKSKRENIDDSNDYREAEPRTPHVCDGVEIPKSVRTKRTRIFAIIGHSSFCTFDDLMKIKANREPKGFRLDLKKYKDFPNVRYIPVQDIGKKSSALRMENFIEQLKNNEKIYSGLLQLDNIKSTRNFNKFVECEFFKENNEDYKFIKKRIKGDNPTLNFNVYPKKDRYGTQNPINNTFEFVSHAPDTPFTGIYELTEEIDASNNNNNNSIISLDIHYDEILFNPDIKTDFFKQREREIQVLKAQTKLIDTQENLSKSLYDPTYISARDLYYTELAALKGSLMMPNSTTEKKLMARQDPIWDINDLKEFTRLNKKLYQLIERRNKFEVSLDDIISIILNDNYMRNNDDFIILDFGCKHIRDLSYANNVWDRPLNTNTRESTVKFDNTLKKEVGPVWVKDSKARPYVLNKLFEEAKD